MAQGTSNSMRNGLVAGALRAPAADWPVAHFARSYGHRRVHEGRSGGDFPIDPAFAHPVRITIREALPPLANETKLRASEGEGSITTMFADASVAHGV